MIGSTHVANTILKKVMEDDYFITPIKLHCLVYLLYSSYLYITGFNLFNEQFVLDNGCPKVSNLWYKFDCYKNNAIKSFAVNAIEEIVYISNDNDVFNYCLDNILNMYRNYSDIELLNYIRHDGNLLNNYNENDVIKNSDILEDEINRNKIVLKNAIKLRKKL